MKRIAIFLMLASARVLAGRGCRVKGRALQLLKWQICDADPRPCVNMTPVINLLLVTD